jgi:hypothetical protein
MLKIIGGLVMTGIGTIFVIKTEWFLENFGRMNWFENKFGTEGGSRLGYKLIGLVLIFVGLLIATNLIGGFMAWALSPLTKYQS